MDYVVNKADSDQLKEEVVNKDFVENVKKVMDHSKLNGKGTRVVMKDSRIYSFPYEFLRKKKDIDLEEGYFHKDFETHVPNR